MLWLIKICGPNSMCVNSCGCVHECVTCEGVSVSGCAVYTCIYGVVSLLCGFGVIQFQF